MTTEFINPKNGTIMKRIFTFTLICLLSLHLAAQDEQQATTASNGKRPSMWLGGEITFGSMSSRDFTFGPDFGLMIGKNIGVGSMLMFSRLLCMERGTLLQVLSARSRPVQILR